MKLLTTTIAKIMFAAPFAVFGILHFMMGEGMAGMVPSWIPAPVIIVYLVGLALIAASVAIISGKMAKNASLALGALLLSFVLFIHVPGACSSDPMVKMMAISALLKDLALAGGAFTYAGIFEAQEGSSSSSVGD